jgi:hypothetical protein
MVRQKSFRSSFTLRRRTFAPRLEHLEDRYLPSTNAVLTFAGNAQHTAIYQPAAQDLNAIHWQTPVDLHPQYSGSDLLIHYGAPLITAANTVIVPVKTGTSGGFEVNAFNGANGSSLYSLATDYILPSHNWTPSYSPALVTNSSGTRLYYAGAGGTIYYVSSPDSGNPGTPVQEVFYTTLANYQANASAFNSTVFVDTPITGDSNGNIFFGFRVQGTAPPPLSTTQSGYARIDPNGNATYVLAGNAANDVNNIGRDVHNLAPALSNDQSTLYVAVKSPSSDYYGYLLGLDSTTLTTKYKVFLKDPRNNNANNAGLLDDGTTSPTIAPDGDVYFGVFGNPYNGSRGFMLRFSSDLTVEKTPGAFGWDYTPAIVPASMVPSYTGTSSYLIFSKYNNYADPSAPQSYDFGDGINKIAILDPNATEVEPHASSNGLLVMREVLTAPGPTPDPDNVGTNSPHAVREWCINTAAVDPATDCIFTPSEDGHVYRWNLATNALSQGLTLGTGIGEAYVPTDIGPDGTVYTINNATLFAVGGLTGVGVNITSSIPDVRSLVTGQALTFTAVITNTGSSGITPTGTVNFQDGSTVLAANVPLDGNGHATYTTSTLAGGAHFIAATYSGDSNFSGGTATLVQMIHQSGTTTTLTSSPNPANFGQSVTFTATVTPLVSGLGAPTGMVTFSEGTTILAQLAVNTSGTASFSTSALAVGSHTITATYYSDPIYATSNGNDSAAPQVVQDATNTALSSAPNPSVFGQGVTLTAVVTAHDAGAGTPTGTVTFTEGSTTLAAGVAVDGTGHAAFTTSALAVGSNTITATFTGTTGWLTSSGNDGAAPQVVNQDGTSTAVGAAPASSVYGQSVTFTATVSANAPGSGTPTGSVTFMDGSTTLAVVSLSNGSAGFTTSSLAVGGHTISAAYGGDGNFTTSSGSAGETVSQDGTSTTVSASPTSSVYGQSVTFTATVTANTPGSGTPTGTITFQEGSNTLAVVNLSHGSASFTTSSLTVSSHTITASYGGDGNFTTSSGSAGETVSQDGTSTTVSASPTSSVYGQSVTFTATVTANAPGSGTPTGTVTFQEGSSTLAVVTLSSGSASFTTSSLAVGGHTITASYGGDGNFTTSSGSAGETVTQDGTTTTVGASPSTSVYGQAVTFTATVTANAPGSGTPTGTVTFQEGSTTLAVVTLSSGSASFTTSSLAVGVHTITASYGGDGNFTTSSASAGETVAQDASTTTVSTSLTPSVYGQSITFTATVTANTPGSGTPSGSVTFEDGTTVLGTGTLNSSGQATFTTATLGAGAHSISAIYGGDGNFTTSTSSTLSQTVNQDATSTVVVSSINPTVSGQAVTFTATVTANAPGSGTPTGSVTFKDGTTTLGTGTLNSQGVAALTTTALGAGTHTIKAVYGGDSNFLVSTSAGITQTVTKASTATSVASSANPAVYSQAITFTATITVNAPGGGVPTGTVTFKDGTSVLGTGTLNGSGQATFTTSVLSVATHSITAVYGGNANYTGSTSAALSQNVTKDGTSTTVVSSLNPSVVGQAVTFTATVTANAPGTGIPNNNVVFKDGTKTLATRNLDSNGQATFTISTLKVGNHSITVVYQGSGHFLTSTSAILVQVVKSSAAVPPPQFVALWSSSTKTSTAPTPSTASSLSPWREEIAQQQPALGQQFLGSGTTTRTAPSSRHLGSWDSADLDQFFATVQRDPRGLETGWSSNE